MLACVEVFKTRVLWLAPCRLCWCCALIALSYILKKHRLLFYTLQGSPKKGISVIIYSISGCSKPIWVSLFCWTLKKTFWRMFVFISSQWGPSTVSKYSFVFSWEKKLIQVRNDEFWVHENQILILGELSLYGNISKTFLNFFFLFS